MSSHRQLRVRELLKREIGEAIRREISISQAGLINVNEVDISADLRQAKVLLGFFGSPSQQKTAMSLLESHRMRIQDYVAKAVILKYVPKLRFEFDDSVDRGNRVLQVIEELEKQKPKPPAE